MTVTCRIWWDEQGESSGWCVAWNTVDDEGERESDDATIPGARNCGLTTLRRRAWFGRRSGLVGQTRRAFAAVPWRWVETGGGYWIASVEHKPKGRAS